MNIPSDELSALLKYQIAALKGMTESLGGHLAYVKPHGALYNTTAISEEEAKTVVEAISLCRVISLLYVLVLLVLFSH